MFRGSIMALEGLHMWDVKIKATIDGFPVWHPSSVVNSGVDGVWVAFQANRSPNDREDQSITLGLS
jgi:hypothetical protein